MGEYADMMLDGTCCAGCGTFIDFDGVEGFPRYCSRECEPEGLAAATMTRKERHAARMGERTNCPICKKRVKVAGLAQHQRDVHGGQNG